MLRSSVVPRMNGSRHMAEPFLASRLRAIRQQCGTVSTRQSTCVICRPDPGSRTSGRCPSAPDRAQLFGGWTDMWVLDPYTRQLAGTTSTSRAGSSAASTSSPPPAHSSIPAGRSAQLMSPIDEGERR
jgi:hypothetical protein